MNRWQESYDRMLAAGPPDPPTVDVTVDYEVWLQKDQPLTRLTEVLGGEAHWAGDETRRDLHRPAEGTTFVEEAASYDEAEEIVKDLVLKHLYDFVDMDTLSVIAERVEPDEPDWDAIEKDRRIEEEN